MVIEEGIVGFNKFEEQIINLLNYLDGLQSEMTINLKVDGCFSPDTKLVTQKGVLTFEEVIRRMYRGEEIMVLSYNFDSKKEEFVTATSPSMNPYGEKKWIQIELENNDVVFCTEDHLIYTNNRGYVEAKDLTPEDDIKEYHGENKS